MQAQPSLPPRRGECRQTTPCPPFAAAVGDEFDDGRERASLEMVSGLMAAIDTLDPNDERARGWYQRLLGDARTIAGLERRWED
jgi:hypothetical protein